MLSNKPESDEKVYAGGSKNFDEKTGKYKNDSPTQKRDTIKELTSRLEKAKKAKTVPSSGGKRDTIKELTSRLEKAKKAKTGSDEKKMTMKERMAQLREMREGRKQRAEEKERREKQTGPGSGRSKPSPSAKKKTPPNNSPALKDRMERAKKAREKAKLERAKKASLERAKKAREKARLERAKKAKMKRPTVRKKK